MTATISFDNTHANDSMCAVVVSSTEYIVQSSPAAFAADLADKTAKSMPIAIKPVALPGFYTDPANVTSVSEFTGRVEGARGTVID